MPPLHAIEPMTEFDFAIRARDYRLLEYDVHEKSSYLSRGHSEPKKREQSVSKKSRLSLRLSVIGARQEMGFHDPDRSQTKSNALLQLNTNRIGILELL